MTISMAKLSSPTLLVLSAVTSIGSWASGQDSSRVQTDVALAAVRFVRTSPSALPWNEQFVRSSSKDVVVSIESTAKSHATPLAFAQADSAAADIFTVAPESWRCDRPKALETAACALETSPFYVLVGKPVLRGDSAMIGMAIYQKNGAHPNRISSSRILVILAKAAGRWQGIRLLKVVE
jgi:hypothetical protein